MGAYEIAGSLQRRQCAATTKAQHRSSLNIAAKTHVSDQATAEIGTYITRRGAYDEKVDVTGRHIHRLKACLNGAAPGSHSSLQIAPIEIVGGPFETELAIKEEMAIVDVAIQENLANSLTFVPTELKGFFLLQTKRRNCRPDCANGGPNSCHMSSSSLNLLTMIEPRLCLCWIRLFSNIFIPIPTQDREEVRG